MTIESINPFNGTLLKSYQSHSSAEVDQKIRETHAAWLKWRKLSFTERGDYLLKAAVMRQRRNELAELMALKWAKTRRADLQKSISAPTQNILRDMPRPSH